MKKEGIKNQIQVGDRVTHIKVSVEVGSYRGYGLGFKTKEVRDKVIEIVTKDKDNEDYKDVLKIERIGSNGWYTVYEKKSEILDEKEKEYLKSVIKPFKSKIEYIKKTRKYYSNFEYVCIVLKENNIGVLPDFKSGTMYKNMKPEKEYTLKELGLE